MHHAASLPGPPPPPSRMLEAHRWRLNGGASVAFKFENTLAFPCLPCDAEGQQAAAVRVLRPMAAAPMLSSSQE